MPSASTPTAVGRYHIRRATRATAPTLGWLVAVCIITIVYGLAMVFMYYYQKYQRDRAAAIAEADAAAAAALVGVVDDGESVVGGVVQYTTTQYPANANTTATAAEEEGGAVEAEMGVVLSGANSSPPFLPHQSSTAAADGRHTHAVDDANTNNTNNAHDNINDSNTAGPEKKAPTAINNHGKHHSSTNHQHHHHHNHHNTNTVDNNNDTINANQHNNNTVHTNINSNTNASTSNNKHGCGGDDDDDCVPSSPLPLLPTATARRASVASSSSSYSSVTASVDTIDNIFSFKGAKQAVTGALTSLKEPSTAVTSIASLLWAGAAVIFIVLIVAVLLLVGSYIDTFEVVTERDLVILVYRSPQHGGGGGNAANISACTEGFSYSSSSSHSSSSSSQSSGAIAVTSRPILISRVGAADALRRAETARRSEGGGVAAVGAHSSRQQLFMSAVCGGGGGSSISGIVDRIVLRNTTIGGAVGDDTTRATSASSSSSSPSPLDDLYVSMSSVQTGTCFNATSTEDDTVGGGRIPADFLEGLVAGDIDDVAFDVDDSADAAQRQYFYQYQFLCLTRGQSDGLFANTPVDTASSSNSAAAIAERIVRIAVSFPFSFSSSSSSSSSSSQSDTIIQYIDIAAPTPSNTVNANSNTNNVNYQQQQQQQDIVVVTDLALDDQCFGNEEKDVYFRGNGIIINSSSSSDSSRFTMDRALPEVMGRSYAVIPKSMAGAGGANGSSSSFPPLPWELRGVVGMQSTTTAAGSVAAANGSSSSSSLTASTAVPFSYESVLPDGTILEEVPSPLLPYTSSSSSSSSGSGINLNNLAPSAFSFSGLGNDTLRYYGVKGSTLDLSSEGGTVDRSDAFSVTMWVRLSSRKSTGLIFAVTDTLEVEAEEEDDSIGVNGTTLASVDLSSSSSATSNTTSMRSSGTLLLGKRSPILDRVSSTMRSGGVTSSSSSASAFSASSSSTTPSTAAAAQGSGISSSGTFRFDLWRLYVGLYADGATNSLKLISTDAVDAEESASSSFSETTAARRTWPSAADPLRSRNTMRSPIIEQLWTTADTASLFDDKFHFLVITFTLEDGARSAQLFIDGKTSYSDRSWHVCLPSERRASLGNNANEDRLDSSDTTTGAFNPIVTLPSEAQLGGGILSSISNYASSSSSSPTTNTTNSSSQSPLSPSVTVTARQGGTLHIGSLYGAIADMRVYPMKLQHEQIVALGAPSMAAHLLIDVDSSRALGAVLLVAAVVGLVCAIVLLVREACGVEVRALRNKYFPPSSSPLSSSSLSSRNANANPSSSSASASASASAAGSSPHSLRQQLLPADPSSSTVAAADGPRRRGQKQRPSPLMPPRFPSPEEGLGGDAAVDSSAIVVIAPTPNYHHDNTNHNDGKSGNSPQRPLVGRRGGDGNGSAAAHHHRDRHHGADEEENGVFDNPNFVEDARDDDGGRGGAVEEEMRLIPSPPRGSAVAEKVSGAPLNSTNGTNKKRDNRHQYHTNSNTNTVHTSGVNTIADDDPAAAIIDAAAAITTLDPLGRMPTSSGVSAAIAAGDGIGGDNGNHHHNNDDFHGFYRMGEENNAGFQAPTLDTSKLNPSAITGGGAMGPAAAGSGIAAPSALGNALTSLGNSVLDFFTPILTVTQSIGIYFQAWSWPSEFTRYMDWVVTWFSVDLNIAFPDISYIIMPALQVAAAIAALSFLIAFLLRDDAVFVESAKELKGVPKPNPAVGKGIPVWFEGAVEVEMCLPQAAATLLDEAVDNLGEERRKRVSKNTANTDDDDGNIVAGGGDAAANADSSLGFPDDQMDLAVAMLFKGYLKEVFGATILKTRVITRITTVSTEAVPSTATNVVGTEEVEEEEEDNSDGDGTPEADGDVGADSDDDDEDDDDDADEDVLTTCFTYNVRITHQSIIREILSTVVNSQLSSSNASSSATTSAAAARSFSSPTTMLLDTASSSTTADSSAPSSVPPPKVVVVDPTSPSAVAAAKAMLSATFRYAIVMKGSTPTIVIAANAVDPRRQSKKKGNNDDSGNPSSNVVVGASSSAREKTSSSLPLIAKTEHFLSLTCHRDPTAPQCPFHHRHLIESVPSLHYNARDVNRQCPYTCAFADPDSEGLLLMPVEGEARKTAKDRVCPGVSEEFFVCPDDECCFCVCPGCYGGVSHKLKGKVKAQIYNLKKFGAWPLVGMLVVLAAQSVYLPVTKTALMIIACHRSYWCTFASCYEEPSGTFIIFVLLSIIVCIVVGVGMIVLFAVLLQRRWGLVVKGTQSISDEDEANAFDEFGDHNAVNNTAVVVHHLNEQQSGGDGYGGGDQHHQPATINQQVASGDFNMIFSPTQNEEVEEGHLHDHSPPPLPYIPPEVLLTKSDAYYEFRYGKAAMRAERARHWAEVVQRDRSLLRGLYNAYTFEGMRSYPFVLLFRVALVIPVVFAPSDSLRQIGAVSAIEGLQLIFWLAMNPFSKHWIGFLTHISSVHQLGQLCLTCFNRAAIREDPTNTTFAMGMWWLFIAYLLVFFIVTLITVVFPILHSLLVPNPVVGATRRLEACLARAHALQGLYQSMPTAEVILAQHRLRMEMAERRRRRQFEEEEGQTAHGDDGGDEDGDGDALLNKKHHQSASDNNASSASDADVEATIEADRQFKEWVGRLRAQLPPTEHLGTARRVFLALVGSKTPLDIATDEGILSHSAAARTSGDQPDYKSHTNIVPRYLQHVSSLERLLVVPNTLPKSLIYTVPPAAEPPLPPAEAEKNPADEKKAAGAAEGGKSPQQQKKKEAEAKEKKTSPPTATTPVAGPTDVEPRALPNLYTDSLSRRSYLSSVPTEILVIRKVIEKGNQFSGLWPSSRARRFAVLAEVNPTLSLLEREIREEERFLSEIWHLLSDEDFMRQCYEKEMRCIIKAALDAKEKKEEDDTTAAGGHAKKAEDAAVAAAGSPSAASSAAPLPPDSYVTDRPVTLADLLADMRTTVYNRRDLLMGHLLLNNNTKKNNSTNTTNSENNEHYAGDGDADFLRSSPLPSAGDGSANTPVRKQNKTSANAGSGNHKKKDNGRASSGSSSSSFYASLDAIYQRVVSRGLIETFDVLRALDTRRMQRAPLFFPPATSPLLSSPTAAFGPIASGGEHNSSSPTALQSPSSPFPLLSAGQFSSSVFPSTSFASPHLLPSSSSHLPPAPLAPPPNHLQLVHMAAMRGDVEMLQRLKTCGCDMTYRCFPNGGGGGGGGATATSTAVVGTSHDADGEDDDNDNGGAVTAQLVSSTANENEKGPSNGSAAAIKKKRTQTKKRGGIVDGLSPFHVVTTPEAAVFLANCEGVDVDARARIVAAGGALLTPLQAIIFGCRDEVDVRVSTATNFCTLGEHSTGAAAGGGYDEYFAAWKKEELRVQRSQQQASRAEAAAVGNGKMAQSSLNNPPPLDPIFTNVVDMVTTVPADDIHRTNIREKELALIECLIYDCNVQIDATSTIGPAILIAARKGRRDIVGLLLGVTWLSSSRRMRCGDADDDQQRGADADAKKASATSSSSSSSTTVRKKGGGGTSAAVSDGATVVDGGTADFSFGTGDREADAMLSTVTLGQRRLLPIATVSYFLDGGDGRLFLRPTASLEESFADDLQRAHQQLLLYGGLGGGGGAVVNSNISGGTQDQQGGGGGGVFTTDFTVRRANADVRSITDLSSALNYAATAGDFWLARLLFDYGSANALLGDAQNDTPLHNAAREGHLWLAAILLSNRANPRALNAKGATAFAVAVERAGGYLGGSKGGSGGGAAKATSDAGADAVLVPPPSNPSASASRETPAKDLERARRFVKSFERLLRSQWGAVIPKYTLPPPPTTSQQEQAEEEKEEKQLGEEEGASSPPPPLPQALLPTDVEQGECDGAKRGAEGAAAAGPSSSPAVVDGASSSINLQPATVLTSTTVAKSAPDTAERTHRRRLRRAEEEAQLLQRFLYFPPSSSSPLPSPIGSSSHDASNPYFEVFAGGYYQFSANGASSSFSREEVNTAGDGEGRDADNALLLLSSLAVANSNANARARVSTTTTATFLVDLELLCYLAASNDNIRALKVIIALLLAARKKKKGSEEEETEERRRPSSAADCCRAAAAATLKTNKAAAAAAALSAASLSPLPLPFNTTPLYAACRYANTEAVKLLLQLLAPLPQQQQSPSSHSSSSASTLSVSTMQGGRTPLFAAVTCRNHSGGAGRVAMVVRLLLKAQQQRPQEESDAAALLTTAAATITPTIPLSRFISSSSITIPIGPNAMHPLYAVVRSGNMAAAREILFSRMTAVRGRWDGARVQRFRQCMLRMFRAALYEWRCQQIEEVLRRRRAAAEERRRIRFLRREAKKKKQQQQHEEFVCGSKQDKYDSAGICGGAFIPTFNNDYVDDEYSPTMQAAGPMGPPYFSSAAAPPPPPPLPPLPPAPTVPSGNDGTSSTNKAPLYGGREHGVGGALASPLSDPIAAAVSTFGHALSSPCGAAFADLLDLFTIPQADDGCNVLHVAAFCRETQMAGEVLNSLWRMVMVMPTDTNAPNVDQSAVPIVEGYNDVVDGDEGFEKASKGVSELNRRQFASLWADAALCLLMSSGAAPPSDVDAKISAELSRIVTEFANDSIRQHAADSSNSDDDDDDDNSGRDKEDDDETSIVSAFTSALRDKVEAKVGQRFADLLAATTPPSDYSPAALSHAFMVRAEVLRIVTHKLLTDYDCNGFTAMYIPASLGCRDTLRLFLRFGQRVADLGRRAAKAAAEGLASSPSSSSVPSTAVPVAAALATAASLVLIPSSAPQEEGEGGAIAPPPQPSPPSPEAVLSHFTKHVVNAHHRSSADFTPLYIAAQLGQTAIVRDLLGYAETLAEPPMPAFAAAAVGGAAKVQKRAADPTEGESGSGGGVALPTPLPPTVDGKSPYVTASPLQAAARFGHLAVIDLLIRVGGADPMLPLRVDKATVLSLACKGGHADVVRYLLFEYLSEPSVVERRYADLIAATSASADGDGITPTSAKEVSAAAPVLSSAVPSPSFEHKRAAVLSSFVNRLCSESEGIDACDAANVATLRTPLQLAVSNSHTDIVALLLKVARRGDGAAAVDVVSGDGGGAATSNSSNSSMSPYITVVDGTGPMGVNGTSMTPLFIACMNDKKDIVSLLLGGRKGGRRAAAAGSLFADPLRPCLEERETPLQKAISNGNIAIAHVLLDALEERCAATKVHRKAEAMKLILRARRRRQTSDEKAANGRAHKKWALADTLAADGEANGCDTADAAATAPEGDGVAVAAGVGTTTTTAIGNVVAVAGADVDLIIDTNGDVDIDEATILQRIEDEEDALLRARMSAPCTCGWTSLHYAASGGHESICERLLSFNMNKSGICPFIEGIDETRRESWECNYYYGGAVEEEEEDDDEDADDDDEEDEEEGEEDEDAAEEEEEDEDEDEEEEEDEEGEDDDSDDDEEEEDFDTRSENGPLRPLGAPTLTPFPVVMPFPAVGLAAEAPSEGCVKALVRHMARWVEEARQRHQHHDHASSSPRQLPSQQASGVASPPHLHLAAASPSPFASLPHASPSSSTLFLPLPSDPPHILEMLSTIRDQLGHALNFAIREDCSVSFCCDYLIKTCNANVNYFPNRNGDWESVHSLVAAEMRAIAEREDADDEDVVVDGDLIARCLVAAGAVIGDGVVRYPLASGGLPPPPLPPPPPSLEPDATAGIIVPTATPRRCNNGDAYVVSDCILREGGVPLLSFTVSQGSVDRTLAMLSVLAAEYQRHMALKKMRGNEKQIPITTITRMSAQSTPHTSAVSSPSPPSLSVLDDPYNIRDANGCTPIHYAILHSEYDDGRNVEHNRHMSEVPLYCADGDEEYPEVIVALLKTKQKKRGVGGGGGEEKEEEEKASPLPLNLQPPPPHCDANARRGVGDGYTALHMAMRRDAIHLVRTLIECSPYEEGDEANEDFDDYGEVASAANTDDDEEDEDDEEEEDEDEDEDEDEEEAEEEVEEEEEEEAEEEEEEEDEAAGADDAAAASGDANPDEDSDSNSTTPLKAIGRGNRITPFYVNPNVLDNNGHSPLWVGVRHDSAICIKYLLTCVEGVHVSPRWSRARAAGAVVHPANADTTTTTTNTATSILNNNTLTEAEISAIRESPLALACVYGSVRIATLLLAHIIECEVSLEEVLGMPPPPAAAAVAATASAKATLPLPLSAVDDDDDSTTVPIPLRLQIPHLMGFILTAASATKTKIPPLFANGTTATTTGSSSSGGGGAVADDADGEPLDPKTAAKLMKLLLNINCYFPGAAVVDALSSADDDDGADDDPTKDEEGDAVNEKEKTFADLLSDVMIAANGYRGSKRKQQRAATAEEEHTLTTSAENDGAAAVGVDGAVVEEEEEQPLPDEADLRRAEENIGNTNNSRILARAVLIAKRRLVKDAIARFNLSTSEPSRRPEGVTSSGGIRGAGDEGAQHKENNDTAAVGDGDGDDDATSSSAATIHVHYRAAHDAHDTSTVMPLSTFNALRSLFGPPRRYDDDDDDDDDNDGDDNSTRNKGIVQQIDFNTTPLIPYYYDAAAAPPPHSLPIVGTPTPPPSTSVNNAHNSGLMLLHCIASVPNGGAAALRLLVGSSPQSALLWRTDTTNHTNATIHTTTTSAQTATAVATESAAAPQSVVGGSGTMSSASSNGSRRRCLLVDTTAYGKAAAEALDAMLLPLLQQQHDQSSALRLAAAAAEKEGNADGHSPSASPHPHPYSSSASSIVVPAKVVSFWMHHHLCLFPFSPIDLNASTGAGAGSLTPLMIAAGMAGLGTPTNPLPPPSSDAEADDGGEADGAAAEESTFLAICRLLLSPTGAAKQTRRSNKKKGAAATDDDGGVVGADATLKSTRCATTTTPTTTMASSADGGDASKGGADDDDDDDDCVAEVGNRTALEMAQSQYAALLRRKNELQKLCKNKGSSSTPVVENNNGGGSSTNNAVVELTQITRLLKESEAIVDLLKKHGKANKKKGVASENASAANTTRRKAVVAKKLTKARR